jgi:hypothetical protein
MCRFVRRAIVLSFIAAGASSCTDKTPVGPTVSSESEARSAALGLAAHDVDALARGIALSLADPGLRLQLIEDMRASSLPRNALHLPSYFAGERGSRLLAAASTHSNLTTARILALTRASGDLELVMPRPMDRTEWDGGDEIVVQGTTLRMAERVHSGPEEAYTVHGEAVRFGVFSKPAFPFVVVRPMEWKLGVGPGARGRAETARAERAISSREEELARLMAGVERGPDVSLLEEDCDPRTAKTPCDDDSGAGGPYGLTLPSGHTYEYCVSPTSGAPDTDYDGVVNTCEYELAYAFRPRLATSSGDCDLGREPYWVVEKGPASITNSVRIFYALSYYYDCGYMGVGSHLGDSEFIWLDIVKQNGGWKLYGAMLSAHWHSEADESSYYTTGSFEYPWGWGTRPIVWVAKDKHANYRSQSVCNAGAYTADTCENGWPNADVEVLEWANLGNRRYRLLDGLLSRTGYDAARGVPLGGTEYYWTRQPFYGWFGPGSSAGAPYSDMFAWFAIGN